MHHRIHKHLKDLYADITQGTHTQNDIYNALIQKGLSEKQITQNIARIYEEFKRSNPHISTFDAFFQSILRKFC